jgi:hypothetical protein
LVEELERRYGAPENVGGIRIYLVEPAAPNPGGNPGPSA